MNKSEKIREEFKTESVEYKTKSILLEKQNLEPRTIKFLRQQVLEKEALIIENLIYFRTCHDFKTSLIGLVLKIL